MDFHEVAEARHAFNSACIVAAREWRTVGKVSPFSAGELDGTYARYLDALRRYAGRAADLEPQDAAMRGLARRVK